MAIGLLKKALKVWVRPGKKNIWQYGMMDDTAGNSFEDLTIFNVYNPAMHGNEIKIVENFWSELENHVVNIPKTNIPIIGGDINAIIDNQLSHPELDKQYFGPWGNDPFNKAGIKKVLPMVQ